MAQATMRSGQVDGWVAVPGSKSVTHRAFLLAAQSTEPCAVSGALLSDDTRATLRCLVALGARFVPDGELASPGVLRFTPAHLGPPREVLDCANAGTALRLLVGTAARLPFPVAFTGDESLRSRPNGALLCALERLGARIESRDGRAPLTVRGPILPGQATLPASSSSQFGSSLLLSLPMLPGPSRVDLEPPVASSPYLDVSLDVAAAFGLRLEELDAPGRAFMVAGSQAPRAAAYHVEADWSTAAFPLVAAAVTGGRVELSGLRADSRQGDRAIADILRSFGCDVGVRSGAGAGGPAGDSVVLQAGDLESPGELDVSATPDLFPILTVLAACARGTTTFTGGSQLRHKESDRISAMAQGLARLGAELSEQPEGMVVRGGQPLAGARVASLGDHRIHMALCVAGLAASGETTVDDAGCAAVSYPTFHADLARLTGRTVEEVAP